MRGLKQTTYERTFTVEGFGELPLDMLRYDSCFPASGADAAVAQRHEGDRRRVRLTCRSLRDTGPTIARWASFGWRVVDE